MHLGMMGSEVTASETYPSSLQAATLEPCTGLCSGIHNISALYRVLPSLKVVCHSLGNFISCLDDIIVMLRSNWPILERAVSRAGWPVYEVRFTGVGML